MQNEYPINRPRRASLPPQFNTPNDRFTDLPGRRESRIEGANAIRRQRSVSDPYRGASLESAPGSQGRSRGIGLQLDAIPEDDHRDAQGRNEESRRSWRDSQTIRARDSALESLNGLKLSGYGEKVPESPVASYGSPVVRQRNPFSDDYTYSPEPGRDFGSPRSRPITRTTPAPHAIAPDQFYLPIQQYQEERPASRRPKDAPEGTVSRLRSIFASMTKEPELPSPPISRAPSRACSPSRRKDDDDEEKSHDIDMIEDASKPRGRPQSEDMFLRAVDISRADAKYGEDPTSRLHELDENGQLYSMTENDRGRRVEIPLPKFPDHLHHLPFDPHVHRDGDGGLRVGPQNPPSKLGETKKLSYHERRKKPKHRIIYNRDSECVDKSMDSSRISLIYILLII